MTLSLRCRRFAPAKIGLEYALSHEGLGLAYYDLNQFFLFEEQMKKAAALDPQDSTPYFYLGLYRWSIRSDAAGALGFFDKALQLHPDDWKSLYQAGNCLEQLGKLLRRAIVIRSDHSGGKE